MVYNSFYNVGFNLLILRTFMPKFMGQILQESHFYILTMSVSVFVLSLSGFGIKDTNNKQIK